MYFDLEWRLGKHPDWSSVWAYIYEDAQGRRGYAPFLRQHRPLNFHLGELKVGSANLTRYTLIGEPLIWTEHCENNDALQRAHWSLTCWADSVRGGSVF